MLPDLIFYVIILSQIFVLSYYLPKKMHNRMRYVFKAYPPKEYPKLYPRPESFYNSYHRNFKIVNNLIIAIGVILMFLAVYTGFSTTNEGAETFVFLYAVLQFLPMIVVEVTEFKQFRLMRELNIDTTRKADLQPRRMMDFVPPKLFGLAVFMFVAAITFDFAIHDYNFTLGHDSVDRAIVLTLGNLYFIGMISWQMFTKKRNPHQDYADRVKQLKLAAKIATVTSIMLSLFFMAEAAGEVFDMEAYKPIIFSVYFQLIATFGFGIMLQRKAVESMNFDVYKADVSTS